MLSNSLILINIPAERLAHHSLVISLRYPKYLVLKFCLFQGDIWETKCGGTTLQMCEPFCKGNLS